MSELVVPICGYPDYTVSESGVVARLGRPLRPCRLKRGGYLAVSLWRRNRGKTWPVHKLVALAFLEPRPTPWHQLAHDDGDETNPHWRNLRWDWREGNEADKVRHGTSNQGERNGAARLSANDVQEIRRRYLAGEKQSQIAAIYGVSSSRISTICTGKGWKHVS